MSNVVARSHVGATWLLFILQDSCLEDAPCGKRDRYKGCVLPQLYGGALCLNAADYQAKSMATLGTWQE